MSAPRPPTGQARLERRPPGWGGRSAPARRSLRAAAGRRRSHATAAAAPLDRHPSSIESGFDSDEGRDDLAVIIVSTNEAQWLVPCLSSVFAHAGDIALDVVVVDNESTDGTRDLVEARFPQARVVRSVNRGFSHANNRGYLTTRSRYVLFLNPDTEVLDGTFEEFVAWMDARRSVGLVGVKQVTRDGTLYPTVGRFPTASRTFLEALGSNQWARRVPILATRELDLGRYDHELACDWTSGSFMLARREALESAGLLDERFFIYAEEVDLCYRVRQAGWDIRHVPWMTIVHHAGKIGISPRMEAQYAYARRQYARKHFAPARRLAYDAAVVLGYGIRGVFGGSDRASSRDKQRAARLALRTYVGLAPPPFGPPPDEALTPGHRT